MKDGAERGGYQNFNPPELDGSHDDSESQKLGNAYASFGAGPAANAGGSKSLPFQLSLGGRSVSQGEARGAACAFFTTLVLFLISVFNHRMSGSHVARLVEQHRPAGVPESADIVTARYCFDTHSVDGALCLSINNEPGVCHRGECVVVVDVTTVIENEAAWEEWMLDDPEIRNCRTGSGGGPTACAAFKIASDLPSFGGDRCSDVEVTERPCDCVGCAVQSQSTFEQSTQFPMFLALKVPHGEHSISSLLGAGDVHVGDPLPGMSVTPSFSQIDATVHSFVTWKHPERQFDGWQLKTSRLAECGDDCHGRALWRDHGLLRSANSYALAGYDQVSIFTRPNGPIIQISNIVSHSKAKGNFLGAGPEVGRFSPGQRIYSDEKHTIESMPHVLSGLQGIRMPNKDSISDAADHEFLCFDISAPASVYVLHDSRAAVMPDWLTDPSWRNEELKVMPHTESDTFRLFGLRFKENGPKCSTVTRTQQEGEIVGEFDHVFNPNICCEHCAATEGCEHWTIRRYRCNNQLFNEESELGKCTDGVCTLYTGPVTDLPCQHCVSGSPNNDGPHSMSALETIKIPAFNANIKHGMQKKMPFFRRFFGGGTFGGGRRVLAEDQESSVWDLLFSPVARRRLKPADESEHSGHARRRGQVSAWGSPGANSAPASVNMGTNAGYSRPAPAGAMSEPPVNMGQAGPANIGNPNYMGNNPNNMGNNPNYQQMGGPVNTAAAIAATFAAQSNAAANTRDPNHPNWQPNPNQASAWGSSPAMQPKSLRETGGQAKTPWKPTPFVRNARFGNQHSGRGAGFFKNNVFKSPLHGPSAFGWNQKGTEAAFEDTKSSPPPQNGAASAWGSGPTKNAQGEPLLKPLMPAQPMMHRGVHMAAYTVHSKRFEKGRVCLGGNTAVGSKGADDNYVVMVGPGGPVLDLPRTSVALSEISAPTAKDPSLYKASTLRSNEPYYIDREYTALHLPPMLEGLSAIKMAESDKASDATDGCFLSFTVNTPVQVLVLFDARAVELPDWLEDEYVDESIELYEQSFENAGGAASTTSTFRVHRRNACLPGESYPCKICIGGNGGGNGEGADHLRGVHANYLVVVAAQEDKATVLNTVSAIVYSKTRHLGLGRKTTLIIIGLLFALGCTLQKALGKQRQYDWRSSP